MTKTYRHIFFDLDHTLWDFEKNSQAAIRVLFDKHQLQALTGCDGDGFFREYSRINSFYWNLFHKGEIDRDTLKHIRFRKTLEHFRCVIREGFCDTLAHDYITLLPSQNHLIPGAIEVLEYLKGKYTLHLITNGFEKVQMEKISRSGLSPYFVHIVTSEGSGFAKPQKEIFHYALSLSGALLRESIFIGDSPEADIKGAINAGMDYIHFNPLGLSNEIISQWSIKSLKELQTLL